MSRAFKASLTRREMIKGSVIASGVLLNGLERLARAAGEPAPARPARSSSQRQLGVVKFVGETRLEMDTPTGEELECRLYTDLSTLSRKHRSSRRQIFISVRAPQNCSRTASWGTSVSV